MSTRILLDLTLSHFISSIHSIQLLLFRICRRNFDEKLRGEEKLGAELFQQKTEITDRDRQLSDAKATMDKYLRDYDALFARTQKVATAQIFFILYCYEIFVVWCGVVWCGVVFASATVTVWCLEEHQILCCYDA